MVFNYIEHLLILVSTITGSVSISAFASLVGISISIVSSALGSKICVKNARFEKLSQYLRTKEKKIV